MSSLFGTLDFVHLHAEPTRFEPCLSQTTNGYHDSQIKSDDEDYVFIDPSNRIEHISSSSSIPNVQKKQLLWQIDYFSVPYYVRIHGNQLFICDKYGLNISNSILRKKSSFSRFISYL
jgi:hypothetical protein